MNSFLPSGFSSPPFQPGQTSVAPSAFQHNLYPTPGVQSGSNDYTIKPSEVIINNEYNCVPLLGVGREGEMTTSYLTNMPVFVWGNEQDSLTIEELKDKYALQWKRRKTEDGAFFNRLDQGLQQHNQTFFAMNLPMVNCELARYCANYQGEDGGAPIPPATEILKLVRILGVCITQKETADLYKIGPDVKVITNSGECDAFNIWGAAETGENGICKRVPPGYRLYFALKPVKICDVGKTVVLNFHLSETALESVEYKKKYVWRIVPFSRPRGEPVDMVDLGLIVSDVAVSEDMREQEDVRNTEPEEEFQDALAYDEEEEKSEGVRRDTPSESARNGRHPHTGTLKPYTLTGYVWKFGYMKGRPAIATQYQLLTNAESITMDVHAIQKLPVVAICPDYLGGIRVIT